MSDNANDRIRRPPLDRTEPIRAWSSLLGGGPLNDVVSRSVELGYRVVDEYIRQGQKAAQRFSDRSFGAETMTSDFQELGVRMMQYTSDVWGLWFEVMDAMLAGGRSGRAAKRDGAEPPASSADGDASEPPARTRVRIEVTSRRPAEVSLDLHGDAGAARLVVQGLRSVDPEKPRLTDVGLTRVPEDGSWALRIRVPDDFPAGVYNGMIVDEETSRPLGTLSVRIAFA